MRGVVLDISARRRSELDVLQLQGLIEIRPQSGSFVFMPSEEDVAEICLFRRLMETAALRLSFARRREETLRQLREAVRAMERARRCAFPSDCGPSRRRIPTSQEAP